MALDIKTGRIVWTRQTTPNDVYNSSCPNKGVNCPEDSGPDFDFGSSAMLLKAPSGKDILVAGQKSGVVYGLDPSANGEILWQTRVGKGGTNGGVQWGMASDGRNVYASVSDVVRPPGVMGGPVPVGSASLDPTQGGGLSALRIEDGQRVWFAPGCAVRSAAAGLQSGAAWCSDSHRWRGVFRIHGRTSSRLLDRGRQGALGLGHREATTQP